MTFEESRRADYAQDVVTVQSLGQNLTALQPHPDELLTRQAQIEQQADQVSRWRSHYEDTGSNGGSCPSEMLIANEYELLKEAWAAFSGASQDRKSRMYTMKADLLEWRDDVTIDDLKDSVQSAANKLDESHGKSRRYFDRFCSSLSSHSAILEVLPNQSQYLSIFCGAVKTLLMASDNYRKTIEGLSKALAEIGDYIHLSVEHSKLANTPTMREAVRQLYMAVFVFLRESMLWYKATRLQRLNKSFDQNFYEKFSDLLDNVKLRAKMIHTRGNVGHHAKTTDIIHITRNMNEKLDRILITQDEDRRNHRKLQVFQAPSYAISLPWDQKAREGCMEKEHKSQHVAYHIRTPLTKKFQNPPLEDPYLGESRSRSQALKDELQTAFQGLNAHILDCIGPNDIVGSVPTYFENNVILAIRDWSTTPGSMLLRVGSIFQIRSPSVTSAVSASVVRAVSELHFPLIHLFCAWPVEQRETSITSAIYSLTRQLVDMIDTLDEESLRLIIARFQELDGKIKTWDKAISTFSELLLHAPSTLFVIIDGIERLEGEQCHQEYISNLINVLVSQSNKYDLCGRVGKRLKVLFTTTGPCASLNKIDDRALKTVVLKRHSTRRRPGEGRLGRSQIMLQSEKDEVY